MLTLRDVINFTELTGAEVDAIAEHEHVSQVSATVLGNSLLESGKGVREIERFIRENLENSELDAQPNKAEYLEEILSQFEKVHHL